MILEDGSTVPRILDQLAFQEERGANGTPHLQGVCRFRKKLRTPSNKFSFEAHWERMRGTPEQAKEYATKEETRDGQTFTVNWPEAAAPYVPSHLAFDDLYLWQKEVVNYVKECDNDREILWIWEDVGNTGKSALARHLVVKEGALMLSGKGSDVKYGVVTYCQKKPKGPPVVIYDIPRCLDAGDGKLYVSYAGIEEVKNACFFSPKYESGMCVYEPPVVVCFANQPPEREKMSADRWKIWRLNRVGEEIVIDKGEIVWMGPVP